jgi:hypothetical protein
LGEKLHKGGMGSRSDWLAALKEGGLPEQKTLAFLLFSYY